MIPDKKVVVIAIIGGSLSIILATYFNYHLWRGLYFIGKGIVSCVRNLLQYYYLF